MKAKRFVWISMAVLVAMSMVLSACQPASETVVATEDQGAAVEPTQETAVEPTQETVEEPTAEPTQPPAEKKVATFIWLEEFDTLNSLYTNMWFVTVLYPIYACQAWWFDENNEALPNLVKEIPTLDNGGISEDGKTITLKLRDDIVWSDGTPITSADFKFTYDMTMADSNTVSSRSPMDLVVSLETPDERTVVVTFAEPYAPWLARLFAGQSGQTIIPEHILKPVFDAEGTIDTAEWNKAPTVGCGPFVFEEWESGGFARFVANDNYWLGRPKMDELFFRFVPDYASQVAALVAGDGDVGTFFDYSEVPELEAAGVKIINSFSGYNEGIYFNQHPEKGNPALKDVKVRQAIALAFNREKLVQDLLLGLTGVAATDWDNSPWVEPSITPWPYDPEKAKALLKEAGWEDTNGDGTVDKDGVELELKYGTTNREVRQDTQAVMPAGSGTGGHQAGPAELRIWISSSPLILRMVPQRTSRWISSSTRTHQTFPIPTPSSGCARKFPRMKTRLASAQRVCVMRSSTACSRSRPPRLTLLNASKPCTRLPSASSSRSSGWVFGRILICSVSVIACRMSRCLVLPPSSISLSGS